MEFYFYSPSETFVVLFLKAFALIFMHVLFLVLINIFAKFSVLKILFHVTL